MIGRTILLDFLLQDKNLLHLLYRQRERSSILVRNYYRYFTPKNCQFMLEFAHCSYRACDISAPYQFKDCLSPLVC